VAHQRRDVDGPNPRRDTQTRIGVAQAMETLVLA